MRGLITLAVVLVFVVCGVAARSVMSTELYDDLGLKPSASQKEVKTSYRTMARKYHPDVNKEEGAKARFERIQRAYDVLKDESSRAEYDRFGVIPGERDSGAPQGGPGGGGGQNPFHFHFHQQRHEGYEIPSHNTPQLSTHRWRMEVTATYGTTLWFVEVYHSHCHLCYQFARAWDELAVNLEGIVRLGRVHATHDPQVVEELKVGHVPAFVLRSLDGEYFGYAGELGVDSMLQWIVERLPALPSVVTATSALSIVDAAHSVAGHYEDVPGQLIIFVPRSADVLVQHLVVNTAHLPGYARVALYDHTLSPNTKHDSPISAEGWSRQCASASPGAMCIYIALTTARASSIRLLGAPLSLNPSGRRFKSERTYVHGKLTRQLFSGTVPLELTATNAPRLCLFNDELESSSSQHDPVRKHDHCVVLVWKGSSLSSQPEGRALIRAQQSVKKLVSGANVVWVHPKRYPEVVDYFELSGERATNNDLVDFDVVVVSSRFSGRFCAVGVHANTIAQCGGGARIVHVEALHLFDTAPFYWWVPLRKAYEALKSGGAVSSFLMLLIVYVLKGGSLFSESGGRTASSSSSSSAPPPPREDLLTRHMSNTSSTQILVVCCNGAPVPSEHRLERKVVFIPASSAASAPAPQRDMLSRCFGVRDPAVPSYVAIHPRRTRAALFTPPTSSSTSASADEWLSKLLEGLVKFDVPISN